MAVLQIFHRLKRYIEDLLFPLRMSLGEKIMSDGNRQIVRVSRTELIKGPCREQELEAMEFVANHAGGGQMNLPRLHRTYRRRRGLYIAMEFVIGDRLDSFWPGLSHGEKKAVVVALREQIETMRSITLPSKLASVVAASCQGGPVQDGILGLMHSVGPFEEIQDFEELLRRNPNVAEYSDLWDVGGARKVRSVLTHADLAPRNIIRRHTDGALVIIDWEIAGWWPDYWEQIKWRFSDFPHLPGWVRMIDETIQI